VSNQQVKSDDSEYRILILLKYQSTCCLHPVLPTQSVTQQQLVSLQSTTGTEEIHNWWNIKRKLQLNTTKQRTYCSHWHL